MKYNNHKTKTTKAILVINTVMVILIGTIVYMDLDIQSLKEQPTCSEKYPDQKLIDIDGDCYLLIGDKLNTYVHESKFDNNVSTISTFEYKPLIIQK